MVWVLYRIVSSRMYLPPNHPSPVNIRSCAGGYAMELDLELELESAYYYSSIPSVAFVDHTDILLLPLGIEIIAAARLSRN